MDWERLLFGFDPDYQIVAEQVTARAIELDDERSKRLAEHIIGTLGKALKG